MAKIAPPFCPCCQAPLAPTQTTCSCGYTLTDMPDESELDLSDIISQVDSIHEQHLHTSLRAARRELTQAIDEFSRTPASGRLNDLVDRISREVARLERELAVLTAHGKDRPTAQPAAQNSSVPGHTAQPGEAFRQTQVAKALEAIRSKPAKMAVPATAPDTISAPHTHADTAAPATEPESTQNPQTPATPAVPAMAVTPQRHEDAPQTVATPETEKSCPQCRRSLYRHAERCICGYSFIPQAPRKVQDDFLSQDELNALRHGVKNTHS